MSKKVMQAGKIVNKATNLFSTSISSVERANNLLDSAIQEDDREIAIDLDKMTKLQTKVKEREVDKKIKLEQINQNNELIKQLKNFVPVIEA